ncbi:hypothetical protein N8482_02405, partial [Chitinophagales bacterium]|nr:hypothetical protein [Chitinophagales bacterium]
EIRVAIATHKSGISDMPTQQKNLARLQAAYELEKQNYHFLSQKRIEASIAGSASISFHRIIQEGTIAKENSSPNAMLILPVSTFLGLLFGSIISLFLIPALSKISPLELAKWDNKITEVYTEENSQLLESFLLNNITSSSKKNFLFAQEDNNAHSLALSQLSLLRSNGWKVAHIELNTKTSNSPSVHFPIANSAEEESAYFTNADLKVAANDLSNKSFLAFKEELQKENDFIILSCSINQTEISNLLNKFDVAFFFVLANKAYKKSELTSIQEISCAISQSDQKLIALKPVAPAQLPGIVNQLKLKTTAL